MRTSIIPAILATTARDFHQRFQIIASIAPMLHLDIMDGNFVPNRTWATPRRIAALPQSTRFEVHLMVREPAAAVATWGRIASVERIIVHAEATEDLASLLATVRATGKKVGLAVNPSTPLRRLLPFLPSSPPQSHTQRPPAYTVDDLLLMANAPGFAGRPFQRPTLRRVASIHRRYPKLPIGVDIGVDHITIPLLRAAGASRLIAGSAIFGQSDPVAAYHQLRHL
ncbi:hypothetical protein HYV74_01535 [Candidatus Uhrbacteria bacterium]|nr:hypothetical protein [Candidatus Uhrbacteria bacterium]